MPADLNPTTQCLLSLVQLVQGIATHQSFTDFEALTQEFCSLKEKEKAYAQQVQKLGGELGELRASSASKISSLEDQQRLEYAKLLNTHHELTTQMKAEKKNLEEKLNVADRTIEEKNHEVSKLQSTNSELTLNEKELISKNEQTQAQLVKTQEEVKMLLVKIDENDDAIQKQKEKLARQGETIQKHKAEVSSTKAELKATRTELKETKNELMILNGFGTPLQEDNTAQA